MITIRKGHMSPDVATWQTIIGVEANGDFDDNTESATKRWQELRGILPDGVVGPQTWAIAGFGARYTGDIDDAFFPKLKLVAMSLGARAKDLLSVMYSESACKATAHNDNPKSLPPEKRYNASGLIQFMPPILLGLGWTKGHAAFRQLSATEQLSWVERYFRPHRGLLVSVGAVYTATFLPALLKHAGDPDFVLTAKHGRLPWAYGPNAAFDANRDEAITVRELEQAVVRNCTGRRWTELVARLSALDEITQPELPAANAASSPTLYPRPLPEIVTGSGPTIHPLSYPLDVDPDDDAA